MDLYRYAANRRLHKETMLTVQPAQVSVKVSSSKLPLRKAADMQDTDQLAHLVATGPHIKDQVDKKVKILDSKTTLVCLRSSKSSLGMTFRGCMQEILRRH